MQGKGACNVKAGVESAVVGAVSGGLSAGIAAICGAACASSALKLTGINVGAGAATGTVDLVYRSKVEHIPIHLGDFVGVGLGALSGVTGNESQMKGWRDGFASMMKKMSNQKDVSW
jgi:hypothetical protein